VKDSLRNIMLSVQRLTRSGRLAEATAAIQQALSGRTAPRTAAPTGSASASAVATASPVAAATASAVADADYVIDVEVRVIDDDELQVVDELLPDELFVPPAAEPEPAYVPPQPDSMPGEFSTGSFSNAAGSRAYKLYVPSGMRTRPVPLIVMLHGCKQNPDDFAAGTRMNQLAEQHGWLVLYPAQARSVNRLGCWNWFKAEDQQRGRGEPAIIAGMTQHIVESHGADPTRVYVAGLSAGGAMADIMATTYPDLFAAAGIHSGLAHAAAHDLISALNAMRQGPSAARPAAAARSPLPTIVFHGDSDTTVHPSNGDHVVAQVRLREGVVNIEAGQVAGGRSYTRTVQRDADGRSSSEHWVVHGAGHAWSGGHTSGSYTDPSGPDASSEMLRFFAAHAKSGAVG